MSAACPTTLPALADVSLFLDFDGTLVDIAPTPDSIRVPPDLPALLDRLSRRLAGRVALVSGRAIDSLERHLPDFGGIIVGGHGAELRAGDGTIRRLAGTDASVAAARDWADGAAAQLPGTLVEIKPTGAALHFRQNPEHQAAATAHARAFAKDHPGLSVQEAHMSIELRPVDADKASAVALLMAGMPFKGHRPIFAGDDKTDIPAMDYCRANGGMAISLTTSYPDADIVLASPAAFRAVLAEWITQ